MNFILYAPQILLGFLLTSVTAHAQLELLPEAEPQQVFGGDGRTINLVWHNKDQATFAREIQARLYQVSSATAAPLGTFVWKKLEVLAGQTAMESSRLSFPVVNAETHFAIQWLDGTNGILGRSEVVAYPAGLLKALNPLAGDEPLGVFDPQNQLKPLLKAAAVEYADLEDIGLENYSGNLAIAGPFPNKSQMREGLTNSLRALAKKGTSVVWLLPPPERNERRDIFRPSFYSVPEGKGAVVVAQFHLTAGLAENPRAQLNLIKLALLARHPETPRLPETTP